MRVGIAGLMKAAAGGGGGTEDVVVNGGTLSLGGLDGPSLASAMSDASDATRVYSVAAGSSKAPDGLTVSLTFADLVGSEDVSQFYLIIRTHIGNSNPSALSIGITGLSVSGPSTSATSSTATTRTIGPYTKPGGGNFTPAQINGITAALHSTYDTGFPLSVYSVSLRATKA